MPADLAAKLNSFHAARSLHADGIHTLEAIHWDDTSSRFSGVIE
jgi:hypothetical protein